ncbi:MAG: hypothetical protein ACOYOR_05005 [Flavobacterium psychrophilum]
MEKKINITSTALEKGIDLAKDFLEKLVIPAVEETGLLLKDKVTLWKFKNQVQMLNNAKAYCEKNNISTKQVSLKLLCPLLDYSGIEEDEIIQDKWAILLSNMVDSYQNIENHVFPYILSQLSTNEFLVLEKVYDDKLARIENHTKELEEFRKSRPEIELNLNKEIEELQSKINELEKTKERPFNEIWELQKEKRKLETKLGSLKYKESSIQRNINQKETVPYGSLKDFETSNLIRLGVIKEEKDFYANSQTLEIPYEREPDYERSHLTVDLNIDVESNTDNVLTELGELFINACKEKNKNAL